jgi:transcriptional regulator with XRE-family HTH domain
MDGAELKKRREALEMTQEELAKELGVDSMTVSRWERGTRSIPSLLPLALETVERKHTKKRKDANKKPE